jgi:hypothetical protein
MKEKGGRASTGEKVGGVKKKREIDHYWLVRVNFDSGPEII